MQAWQLGCGLGCRDFKADSQNLLDELKDAKNIFRAVT